jgi:hypothetical protein
LLAETIEIQIKIMITKFKWLMISPRTNYLREFDFDIWCEQIISLHPLIISLKSNAISLNMLIGIVLIKLKLLSPHLKENMAGSCVIQWLGLFLHFFT